MMKEILVHTGIGHEGICLITPIVEGDMRCMYPRAISLMTEKPLQETKKVPITLRRKDTKNMRQYSTYAAYNTSHGMIILPKNQLVGQSELILQPNKVAYQQELSAMRQERIAENQEPEESIKEDKLSRDCVKENFQLKDNPIVKANPKVGERKRR